MDRVPLYEEYRLIERSENEINGAWKGVHLLLFFLAFVFGSFCTFCFHMLMYLFDEKCVLFPKLLSLTSSRHNVIYEFIPEDKEGVETPSLPVDFLSTQWVEKSACYLPTFVPLVSGIFGLVWTTMFLMCSTGSRTLTGLQRPWRVLPPVFVFSLAMGGICIYSSSVTHYGLKQLCVKLGEITGTSTCSYTVNVATLAYERRIRGVYQATWLTIISAWLHTFCWLLSALVALLRILLAVDFQLVRISVDLIGDVDKLLESREEQIRTVSPTGPGISRESSVVADQDTAIFHYRSKSVELLESLDVRTLNQSDSLHYAHEQQARSPISELSLVPAERDKLARLEAIQSVPKNRHFIVKLFYDFFEHIDFTQIVTNKKPGSVVKLKAKSKENLPEIQSGLGTLASPSTSWETDAKLVATKTQHGALKLELERDVPETDSSSTSQNPLTPFQSSMDLTDQGNVKLSKDKLDSVLLNSDDAEKREHVVFESSLNLKSEMKYILNKKLHKALKESDIRKKKSNLKRRQTETETRERSKKHRKVQILDSNRTIDTPTESESEHGSDTTNSAETKEKDTQTKEKQD